MLNSPRWIFFREVFPGFDRFVIHLEKFSKKTGFGYQKTRHYLSGISVSKLPKNILYGIMIVFLGYFALFSIMWATGNPMVKVGAIRSGSMEPAIKPGSLVVTSPYELYGPGDIITYKERHPRTGETTGRTITHRIIVTKDTEDQIVYITQGDANKVPDINDIKKDDIYGKVLYTIPWLGYVYSFVNTVPGFIVLIVIPAFILIRNEIRFIKYNSVMNRLRSDNDKDLKSIILNK